MGALGNRVFLFHILGSACKHPGWPRFSANRNCCHKGTSSAVRGRSRTVGIDEGGDGQSALPRNRTVRRSPAKGSTRPMLPVSVTAASDPSTLIAAVRRSASERRCKVEYGRRNFGCECPQPVTKPQLLVPAEPRGFASQALGFAGEDRGDLQNRISIRRSHATPPV